MAIVVHAIHQQRVENHVQLAALVASTNVLEDRRTWRAIMESCLVRLFNKKALDKKRSNETDKTKRDKITRVEGDKRIEQFGDMCNDFDANVNAEHTSFGSEKLNTLLECLTGSGDKTSGEDVDKTIERCTKGIDKTRKITKAEQNMNGVDIKAEKGGRVVIKDLVTEYKTQVKAEIEARQIELPKDFEDMTMKGRREILRLDEMKNRMIMGLAREGTNQLMSKISYQSRMK